MVAPGTRDSENYDHIVPSGTIENIHSEMMQEALAEPGATMPGASMHGTARPEPADNAHPEQAIRKQPHSPRQF